jgi:hypothetical protein
MSQLSSATCPISPTITPVDAWFYNQAQNLRLLAPAIELNKIQLALQTHLPQRVKRYLPRLANPQDVNEWLKLIGKTGEIVQLWRSRSVPEASSSNEPILVGINVSNNLRLATQQIKLIDAPEFQAVREDLGISYRWELVLPNFPEFVPKRSELLDLLYQQLDREIKCDVIVVD